MIIKFRKLRKKPLWGQLIFWTLSAYFIGSYFSISNTLSEINLIYSLCFHICLVFLVYTNTLLLIPKLLTKKNIIFYILSCPAVIAITWGLHEIIFELLIPALPWEYYIVSFTDIWILLIIFFSYFIFTTLFTLSKSWFRLQQLEKEKADMELSNLMFQINPHFLLNSLNSLYGLSLRRSDETSKYILKLSSILKHSLYETKNDLIPLSEEISYIKDYISLHKIRWSDEMDVSFKVNGEVKGVKIAPFLIIPLVENAFKHGIGTQHSGGYAYFHLEVIKENLIFISKNSIGKQDETTNKKYNGIGLDNVKKRLHLLYTDKHDLQISDNSQEFLVQLKLKYL